MLFVLDIGISLKGIHMKCEHIYGLKYGTDVAGMKSVQCRQLIRRKKDILDFQEKNFRYPNLPIAIVNFSFCPNCGKSLQNEEETEEN